MQLTKATLTAMAVTTANAAMHMVEVGMDSMGKNALAFNPATVMAAKGDMIQFTFYPMNHSVVLGSYDDPCMPAMNAWYSGYIPSKMGMATETFMVMVNNTDPQWFYCSQGEHCQGGMVGVINPPMSGQTLDAYMSAAANVSMASAPSMVAGGMVSSMMPTGTMMSTGTMMPTDSMMSTGTMMPTSTMMMPAGSMATAAATGGAGSRYVDGGLLGGAVMLGLGAIL